MPTIPKIMVRTNTAPEVLNAIRNSATQNYKNYIPYATSDAESAKTIGAIMLDNVCLANEFLNALVNRIAYVIITSKLYENPIAMFKKGSMEMGETVEEVFVDLCKPHQYDPAVAESELFKRETPNVRSAFHVLNYQKFYKQTINQDMLRTAFLSWAGVDDLIAKIVNTIYTSANYDEFLTTKYMLARHILEGEVKSVKIAGTDASTAKSTVATVKGTSNTLEFLNRDYNIAGVANYSLKDDQFILINSMFDAIMDVEVLSAAFNMEKAEFLGHRILVDSFGALDTERLNQLFANDPYYLEISEDDKAELDKIPMVIVDRDFFMIFDMMQKFTEQFNAEGIYWNYFFHAWKVFSVSPFAQAVFFTAETQTVTSVVVTPKAVTVSKGKTAQLTVNVQTTNFAPQSVNWVSDSENVTVDSRGIVTVLQTATAGDTATITVSSTFDNSKSDTATITIG